MKVPSSAVGRTPATSNFQATSWDGVMTNFLLINRDVGGGKLVVVDYSRGAGNVRIDALENWGDHPWLEISQARRFVPLAGRFMDRDEDQLLAIRPL